MYSRESVRAIVGALLAVGIASAASAESPPSEPAIPTEQSASALDDVAPQSIAVPDPVPAVQVPAKAAPKPFKDPFYNNDFSYLDAPDYLSCDPFDRLKRICLAPCLTLDVGGEYRLRFHDEDNMRLSGADDEFLLQRTRLYTDWRYDGWIARTPSSSTPRAPTKSLCPERSTRTGPTLSTSSARSGSGTTDAAVH